MQAAIPTASTAAGTETFQWKLTDILDCWRRGHISFLCTLGLKYSCTYSSCNIVATLVALAASKTKAAIMTNEANIAPKGLSLCVRGRYS
jgi:hypothetical protein